MGWNFACGDCENMKVFDHPSLSSTLPLPMNSFLPWSFFSSSSACPRSLPCALCPHTPHIPYFMLRPLSFSFPPFFHPPPPLPHPPFPPPSPYLPPSSPCPHLHPRHPSSLLPHIWSAIQLARSANLPTIQEKPFCPHSAEPPSTDLDGWGHHCCSKGRSSPAWSLSTSPYTF